MMNLNRKPRNFIVDLNNVPYQMDLSPITVGMRRFQAPVLLVLALLCFAAGFWDMPILVVLSIPMAAYGIFLLRTSYKITFYDNYAEIFTESFISDAKTTSLFYQNYQGVQVGTRGNAKNAVNAVQEDFTITLVHSDPAMNLPLFDLKDSARAYNLAQLYAQMLDVPLLPARLYSGADEALPAVS